MMGKYVLCLWMLLASAKLFAQQENYFMQADKNGRDKFFYAGVALGINASQIDGDYFSGFHKAGLNTGIISYIKFNPQLYGNIELLYSAKGARSVQEYNSPQVGTVPVIYSAKLNYVEIPLLIHYQVQDHTHAGIGLSYNRLFSAKESIDEVIPNSINRRSPNFKQEDINLLLSIAYQLSGNLFARARYQYSLTTIRDAAQIPIEFGTPSQHNNLFALQFFLLF
jgi:uncharacterized protein (UPF0332 family)